MRRSGLAGKIPVIWTLTLLLAASIAPILAVMHGSAVRAPFQVIENRVDDSWVHDRAANPTLGPAATASSTIRGTEQGGERWVGPVVFHWFGPKTSPGQFQSVWLPLEGRSAWNGSVDFWLKQERDIIDAGFNLIFFQVAAGWELEQTNHLLANRALLEEGQWAPLIAPNFAAESWDCYLCQKDFTTEDGRNTFYEKFKSFFDRYFEVLPRERLVTVSGRVLIDLWWVPDCYAAPSDILAYIGDRLEQDFSITPYWSTHDCWAHTHQDELNYLFNGVEPFRLGSRRNADLLPGAWRPNQRYPDFVFLPRDGGRTYAEAWSHALGSADTLDRIYVESWNEYTEGTGLYEAVPITHTVGDGHPTTVNRETCWDNPCHPVEYNDTWGPDPRLYIRLSALNAQVFLERVNDASFVAQSVPTVMEPGGTYPVSITMRNEGTTTWSRTTEFRLGAQDGSATPRWGFDRVELNPYELVAPGMTRTFTFTVRAPSAPGTYSFQWRMVQEGIGWFGEATSNLVITVEPAPLGWGPASVVLVAAVATSALTAALLLARRKKIKPPGAP